MARRISTWGAALGLALLLSACGGGGGGSSSTSNTSASYPPSAASLSDSNVVAIQVKPITNGNINIPYVSVTVCVPGSTTSCKTIDNVLLDTGSTGLRLFASQMAASPALTLPRQSIGGSSTISECAQFLNNLAWGTVNLADVVMGGERAYSVPVQLMNAGMSAVPTSCYSGYTSTMPPLLKSSSDTNAPTNSQDLRANGILGVGLFAYDGQYYYNNATPTTSSTAITATASQQVQNPVSLFTTSGNSNGVVIQLPSLASYPTGVNSASGYLIFGVGTRSNNLLGSANVVPVSSNSGTFTSTYKGYSYTAFIDSGSNGLYFTDPAPSVMTGTCPSNYSDFYCPSTTQNLSGTMQLASSTATVSFSIANASTLFAQNSYAYSNLGGTIGSTCNTTTFYCGYFDWGLPFFFGRTVYTVIENRSVGSLTGPFNAFTN